MRTTIDLPEELLMQAKLVAAERGIPLRELVSEAIARALAVAFVDRQTSSKPRRAKFPIFRSSQPGTLQLTSADLARAEAEEDRRRHGLSG